MISDKQTAQITWRIEFNTLCSYESDGGTKTLDNSSSLRALDLYGAVERGQKFLRLKEDMQLGSFPLSLFAGIRSSFPLSALRGAITASRHAFLQVECQN